MVEQVREQLGVMYDIKSGVLSLDYNLIFW